MKSKNTIKILTLSLVSLIILPMSAQAIGQLTEPIVVDNAAKGQVITKTLKLFSSNSVDSDFGLVGEGDIATWVKFYKTSNLDNPITSINIPANGKIDATVAIQVPSDVRNGTYEGKVSLTSRPDFEESDGSQVTATQKIGRPVKITVIGEEQVDGEVSIIPVGYGIDSGQPLEVRFIITNNGNVAISPQIQAKIKDIDQEGVINTTIYPYPEDAEPINALERREIEPLRIPTGELEDARYWIEFTVTADSVELAKEQFRFTLGEAGDVEGASFAEQAKSYATYLYIAGFIVLVIIIGFVGIKLKNRSN